MLSRRACGGLLFAILLALLPACGGDDAEPPGPLAPTATATTPPGGATTPIAPREATELRVAFINLMSPVGTDATDTAASDTYEERLALIIEELRTFNPDIVGFNEATITDAHGDARERLATALKMEPFWLRANPWFPTRTREANDAIAKQIGFQEGELLLVRSDRFPLIGGVDSHWINPRTSETEGRVAFHIRVRVPGATGEADIYITHLTGGGEAVRGRQAESVASFIRSTRGDGPAILMGDLSDVPTSGAFQAFAATGFHDPFAGEGVATCCRTSLTGEQQPLTLRTDYLLGAEWAPVETGFLAAKPGARNDGSPLFASDHLGLFAVFTLPSGLP
jgi:endonuclease/exonuclease/phosphatase family metal-dependent hydrolase